MFKSKKEPQIYSLSFNRICPPLLTKRIILTLRDIRAVPFCVIKLDQVLSETH